MLGQRVITALILLPLLLAAIFKLSTPHLYFALGSVGLAGAWEWCTLMGVTVLAQRLAYIAAMALVLAGFWFLALWPYGAMVVCVLAAIWWLAAIPIVRGYPANFAQGPWPVAKMAPLGLLLVPSTLLALVALHKGDNGPWRVMFVFFIVFAADVGAYLVGRNFGKRKLAPAVSPGKSVEGAVGGIVLVALWALAAGPMAFQLSSWPQIISLVSISIGAALISIFGDLTESMFKRLRGIKDSSNLLPGHGGILDRIDSILAAAPIFYLGVALAGL